ncbi:hypothetical protein D9M71_584420 [compost metagenome]
MGGGVEVARLNSDGELDRHFGNNGWADLGDLTHLWSLQHVLQDESGALVSTIGRTEEAGWKFHVLKLTV